MGAVSPPGGDFSDPVTTATLSIVQARQRAGQCAGCAGGGRSGRLGLFVGRADIWPRRGMWWGARPCWTHQPSLPCCLAVAPATGLLSTRSSFSAGALPRIYPPSQRRCSGALTRSWRSASTSPRSTGSSHTPSAPCRSRGSRSGSAGLCLCLQHRQQYPRPHARHAGPWLLPGPGPHTTTTTALHAHPTHAHRPPHPHTHARCWCPPSRCRYIKALEPFYDSFDPDFVNARKAAREILQKEDDLNEIVQLVGKVGSDAGRPFGHRARWGAAGAG